MTSVAIGLALLTAQPGSAETVSQIIPGTIAVSAEGAADPRVAAARAPYAEAVESALLDAGFTVIPSAQHARYVVRLAVSQEGKGAVTSSARSGGTNMLAPLGGTVGGGVSIGLRSGKTAMGELVATALDVSITRRGEAAVAWQGRAVTHQVAGTRDGAPDAIAGKLANALVRNLPQPSGQTVSVP